MNENWRKRGRSCSVKNGFIGLWIMVCQCIGNYLYALKCGDKNTVEWTIFNVWNVLWFLFLFFYAFANAPWFVGMILSLFVSVMLAFLSFIVLDFFVIPGIRSSVKMFEKACEIGEKHLNEGDKNE